MNAEEAIALARFARAARPQQKWDDYTPDAWALLLDDVRYEDAREAVRWLGKNAAYIDVEAIRKQIKRIRSDRIDRHLSDIPPYPNPDDVASAQAWQRDWERRLGDGEVPPAPALVAARAMPRIDGLLKRPPRADVTAKSA